MHEGDLQPEHPPARLGVDQLGAELDQFGDGGPDVVDLVGHMVHAGPSAGEESPHRRVLRERGQKLDAALADANRRSFDALILDRGPMLDASAEETLVAPDGLVKILDGNADVVDAACVHPSDAM